ARFLFVRNDEKILRDSFKTGGEREEGEDNQRNDHHRRRFVSGARGIAPWFAEKNNKNLPRNVKRSQECGRQADDEDRHVALEGEREDVVLAEKTAEWRTTDQRQRADGERRERDFQFLTEPAHIPNVLLVMQGDDDRARGKKEERFEKRVCEKMKHRR